MSVLNIRKAVRGGSRVIISIAGVSGSGKTASALKIARGLASSADRVFFIDTESRRGLLYSEWLDAPFRHADLPPPYAPSRVAAAVRECAAAGAEVIVVDSMSLAWEGPGSAWDIAHAGNPRLPRWNEAKAEWKDMQSALLTCGAHVIPCLRAREKVVPEKIGGKIEMVNKGLQPIVEKNWMFESTVSLMMADEGRSWSVLKCPRDIASAFAGPGYLSESTGRQVAAWLSGGNRRLEAACARLEGAAQRGRAALDDLVSNVPADLIIPPERLAAIYAAADAVDSRPPPPSANTIELE